MPELPVKGVRLPSLSRSENSSKVIDKGQFVIDSDTNDLYLGDGITTYGSLTAINGGGGGGTSYKSFSEASVDEIKEAIEKGLYRTVYNIGDTRKIELSDGKTYTARIMDFDTYYQADSMERTHILLELDELYSEDYKYNSTNTNSGGWKQSELRTSLESLYEENKDKDILSLCVVSRVYTNSNGTVSGYDTSDDHFFIPSLIEVFGGDQLRNSNYVDMIKYSNTYCGEGRQWAFYKDLAPQFWKTYDVSKYSDSYFEGETFWVSMAANKRLIKWKVDDNTSNYGSDYWLRSIEIGSSPGFWYVSYYGGLGYTGASYSHSVPICWCI